MKSVLACLYTKNAAHSDIFMIIKPTSRITSLISLSMEAIFYDVIRYDSPSFTQKSVFCEFISSFNAQFRFTPSPSIKPVQNNETKMQHRATNWRPSQPKRHNYFNINTFNVFQDRLFL